MKKIIGLCLLGVYLITLSACDSTVQNEDRQKASDTNTSQSTKNSNSAEISTNKVFGKDEWWEVDGLWKLKVNSVTTTEERNQFDESNPAQVVVVSYSYENLGYEDDIQDLYFTPEKVIDSGRKVASTYPGGVNTHPQPTPVGAIMENSEEAYGLSQPDGSVKIIFEKFDKDYNKHTATFEVAINQ